MIRFFAQTILTILGNAAGLLIAATLLDGFKISGFGFFSSVLFFTIAQIILAPFVLKMAIKYLPAIRGGIALVTTFVVLVITATFTSGLSVRGLQEWLLAPLIIWVVTVVAGVLLPLVIFKKALAGKKTTN